MPQFILRGLVSLCFLYSVNAQVQPVAQPPKDVKLSCYYVYPVQIKFLQKHVTFAELSKALEKRTIEQFIRRLDGTRLYLLEKDAGEIKAAMQDIFEKTRHADCASLELANGLMRQRSEERLAHAKEYLGADFKFNAKAQFPRNLQKRPRAKSMAEANKFHDVYMQYQIASYLANDLTLEEAKRKIIKSNEQSAKRVRELKGEELISNYLDSFALALDPHSSYLSPEGLTEFQIQMQLSLDGIGATLHSDDGITTIEQLIPGGAAAVSGKLKSKDKILAVAQDGDGPFVPVMDMEIKDVVKLIRGPKGTQVRLRISRKVGNDRSRLEVSLIRDKIKLEDQAAWLQFIDKEIDGQKTKIALINLPSFYHDGRKDGPSAAADVKKLLQNAVKNNAAAVILDLSGNGGGSLGDAVDLAGLFFATGDVVKQSQRATSGIEMNYQTLGDKDPAVEWAGPLVLLTSRVSASASEIVAGTLQDYRRAVIVGGDRTFGKGTFQSVEDLISGLGAVKTTVGMFFTPGGASTQIRGVSGDIVLPSVNAVDEVGERAEVYSLSAEKIAPFVSPSAFVSEGPNAWTPLDKDLIHKLQAKAKPRITASKEFQKIRAELAKDKQASLKNIIVVGDLLKSNDKPKAEKKPEPDVEAPPLSRDQQQKKYLERAEVKEAANVASDLILELRAPHLKLGSKSKSRTPSAQVK